MCLVETAFGSCSEEFLLYFHVLVCNPPYGPQLVFFFVPIPGFTFSKHAFAFVL